MKSGIRYQGLGNEFILLDWLDQPYQEALNYLDTPSWIQEVQEISNREKGYGADGVIVILKSHQQPGIHAIIYNCDGSYASFCGNGARCVADYLRQNSPCPQRFKITVGTRIVECHIESLANGPTGITTLIPAAQYLGEVDIQVAERHFTAHKVDVGNPHLVILQEIDLAWLSEHGRELEYYFGYEHRHNIEFVWPQAQALHYQMLVYERGAGLTQACGSGAMATAAVLEKIQAIKPLDKVTIHMPGGSAIVWLNEHHEIALHADAKPIEHGKMGQKQIQ